MDLDLVDRLKNNNPADWNEWRRLNPAVDLDLSGANFDGVDLRGRNLSGAKFRAVSLREANLAWSNFRNADLNYAKLNGANLQRADLSGTAIFETDFSDADLRQVEGLRLDCSKISRTRFSPDSTDLWSVLRRAYTGPRLLFNVLLLIAFVIPYILRTSLWLGVNDFQESFIVVTSRMAGLAEKFDHPSLAQEVRKIGPCLRPECSRWHVGAVLFGIDQGIWAWMPAVALLLYNVLRAFLTYWVSQRETKRSDPGCLLRTNPVFLRIFRTVLA